MSIIGNYNRNKFSIYNGEEKSVLRLIETLGNLTENLITEVTNLDEYTRIQLEFLLGEGLGSVLSEKLMEMKESGQLATIINELYLDLSDNLKYKEDKKTSFNEDYTSVITNDIKGVAYNTIIQNMGALQSKYPTLLSIEDLGNTMLGRPIKAIILGKTNAPNKLLVIGGHHAREQHSATIVLKQLELYCHNWGNLYNGERVIDIFNNTSLFVIPSLNPDGLELCRIGIDSIPTNYANRETLINNIKLALETKIKTNLQLNSDITIDTDLPVIWEGEHGTVPNYVFRNKDMHMWKSNANGVDIHYNCWETGVNEVEVKAWASTNGYDKGFASEDYIGAIGMGELENVALKNFMNKYNLWTYNFSYHGKGPTCFWNYGQLGQQLRRNYKIVNELSNLSKSPYSPTVNGPVGFSGYVLAKNSSNFLTTSMIRETGWGNVGISLDNNYVDTSTPYTICPLDNWQQPHIWQSEKYVPIHFIQKYVRRQDIKERDVEITTFDLTTKLTSGNGYFDFPVALGSYCSLKWGTTTVTFNANQLVMVTVNFEKPFKTANFIVSANCFNDVADNKFNINCSKELSKMVIRIYSPTTITGTFNINWCALGL